MANSCNPMCRQGTQRGRRVADHDVQRKRRTFSETRDQSDIRQTGREEPIGAGFRIRACTLDRLDYESIVMLFGRSLEKDICPRIDEEADAGRISRLPNASDAIALIDRLAEASIRRKAVFEVAAYGPRVDRETDGLADRHGRVAVAAFQIDRDR